MCDSPSGVKISITPGPSKYPPVSRPAPLPPTETGDKATKTTINTIYMISSTNRPFVSSLVEDPPDLPWHHLRDPPDLPWHHLRDDREIYKTNFDFTPFPLNHSVESVLPIKDQILSSRLANDLHLDKGAYLFTDANR